MNERDLESILSDFIDSPQLKGLLEISPNFEDINVSSDVIVNSVIFDPEQKILVDLLNNDFELLALIKSEKKRAEFLRQSFESPILKEIVDAVKATNSPEEARYLLLKKLLQNLLKKLGFDEGRINICDNPLADLIKKIADIINNIGKAIQTVIGAIMAILALLNIPKDLQILLSLLMNSFYCNFKAATDTQLLIMPSIADKIKLPKPPADIKDAEKVIRSLLDTIAKLGDLNINLLNYNTNNIERYEDLRRRLDQASSALIQKIKEKQAKINQEKQKAGFHQTDKKAEKGFEDLSRELVKAAKLVPIESSGYQYNLKDELKNLDCIALVNTYVIPCFQNLNNNVNTISNNLSEQYNDINEAIQRLSSLVSKYESLLNQ